MEDLKLDPRLARMIRREQARQRFLDTWWLPMMFVCGLIAGAIFFFDANFAYDTKHLLYTVGVPAAIWSLGLVVYFARRAGWLRDFLLLLRGLLG